MASQEQITTGELMLRSEPDTSTWDSSQKHTSVLKCIFHKIQSQVSSVVSGKSGHTNRDPLNFRLSSFLSNISCSVPANILYRTIFQREDSLSLDIKPAQQGNCLYFSLLFFFCITIFFWPFNLSSALQRSPYISSFCHLTLFADRALFTFFSLSGAKRTIARLHILMLTRYHKQSKLPLACQFLIPEKPSTLLDSTNESWLLLVMSVCSQECGLSVSGHLHPRETMTHVYRESRSE